MEPFPGVEPGGPSLPRTNARRREGPELGAQGSNLECPGPRPGGSADSPTAHQSPSPGSNWAGGPYKELPDAGPKGMRVLGAIRTRTAGDLNAVPPAIGLRGHGAATRCRPGSPSLRGRGRSRARRHGCQTRTRTSIRGFRVRCPAIGRSGIGYGRCGRAGIRTLTDRYLRAVPLPLGYVAFERWRQ
jgi:hypothetical protein